MSWNDLTAAQQQAYVLAHTHKVIIIELFIKIFSQQKSVTTADFAAELYDQTKTDIVQLIQAIRVSIELGCVAGVEGRRKAGLIQVGDIKWVDVVEIGEMKVPGKHYRKSKLEEKSAEEAPAAEELLISEEKKEELGLEIETISSNPPPTQQQEETTLQLAAVKEDDYAIEYIKNQSDVQTEEGVNIILPEEPKQEAVVIEAVEEKPIVVGEEIIQAEPIDRVENSLVLHSELPKVEEKKKRGFPAGMIRTGCGGGGPRLDPIEKAKKNPKSKKLAIYAKCFDCMGGRSDPGVVRRIRECPTTSPDCSLLGHRPYRNTKANTIEELTDVDLKDEEANNE